jgi:hypothetical protein
MSAPSGSYRSTKNSGVLEAGKNPLLTWRKTTSTAAANSRTHRQQGEQRPVVDRCAQQTPVAAKQEPL